MKVYLRNLGSSCIVLASTPAMEALQKRSMGTIPYDKTYVDNSVELQHLLRTKQIDLKPIKDEGAFKPFGMERPRPEQVEARRKLTDQDNKLEKVRVNLPAGEMVEVNMPMQEKVATMETGFEKEVLPEAPVNEDPLSDEDEFFKELSERRSAKAMSLIQNIEVCLIALKDCFNEPKPIHNAPRTNVTVPSEPTGPTDDKTLREERFNTKHTPVPEYPNLSKYLSLSFSNRQEFLRTSRDVGLLRMIARFETKYVSLKKIAIGKVSQLEHDNDSLERSTSGAVKSEDRMDTEQKAF